MSPRAVYTFASFRLDVEERGLFQRGRRVALTPKAVDTLLVLVERHGRLVTKDELFTAVWPDAFVEENNLAQHISALRRILAADPQAPVIETVPKRGYRFVGDVVVSDVRTEVAPPSVPVETRLPETPRTPAPEPRARTGWGWPVGLAALVGIALVALAGQVSLPETWDEAAGLTRIAVLPFSNLGAAGDETFVAGLTEEIASRLGGLQQLAVRSSTTVAGYDRTGKTAREIGADLGVQYFVEGSVRWATDVGGARVRVTPRLVRASDDTTVWTHPYDAPLVDLLGVQTDIAHQITSALQVAIDARERRALSARPTEDSEAYMAYLNGLAFAQQGWSDTASTAQARAWMEKAVARDPRFALAWSWLARILARQYRSGAGRSAEIRVAGDRAAQTALALAPDLPDAHLGMVEILLRDRDYDGAEQQLAIVRMGLPQSSDVWRLTGIIMERVGRWRDGRTAYLRAFDLDPASLADPLAQHYLHMRQYDEARRYAGLARAANRSGAIVPEAWARFSETGDIAAARAVLETALAARSDADGRVLAFLARLEWFDGRYERALALIARMGPAGAWLAPNFRYPAAIAAGQVYESMGRADEARRQFEAALGSLQARGADSDDYQQEAAMAFALAGLGRRADAIRHAERAVALLPVSRDAAEGVLYLYVLAQVQARVGDLDAALATLDRLFDIPGFYSEAWLTHEPWFASLSGHPGFRQALSRWSTRTGDALLHTN
jgi:DNA-binding winged helix-turn-helix (wHTH) protein/TolB-like protein/tetratricopeptide (TPR) repeat protein